jgi:hypothetical protein
MGFCKSSERKVGNVVVSPIVVDCATDTLWWAQLSTSTLIPGIFLLVSGESYSIGGFLLVFAVINLLAIECINHRLFIHYNNFQGGKLPWYCKFIHYPVLFCDAMVLLQHRLVKIQKVSEEAQSLARDKNWPCDLYPMVRVDLDTMRARMSLRLEFDLRTGLLYADGAENRSFIDARQICEFAKQTQDPVEEVKEPLL